MLWLWTDVLFWLLCLLLGFGFFRLSRHTYWQMVWREVVVRPMAVVCMMVLAFFVILTTLDSVHFNPSGPQQHVMSLLDRSIASTAMLVHEKSYSRPMANHLDVKSNQLNVPLNRDGFPYLRVTPKRLQQAGSAYQQDWHAMLWQGLLKGIMVCACMLAFMGLLMAYRLGGWSSLWMRCVQGRMRRAFAAFVITFMALCVLTAVVFQLASHYHVMGTDKIGRDVLYMAIKSVRTAVLIGTLTTLLMLPFAIFFGLMAGAVGGWVDDLVQYIYTTISSIPSVLLISAMVLVMQVYIDRHPALFPSGMMRADVKLLVLCGVLGLSSWTQLCRLLRAEAMKLRELDYIHFATTIRVPTIKILFRHMLPNVTHIVLINIILDFSGLVLAESVLSYVGVGVDPSLYSWGNMINAARLELSRDPTVWWPLITVMVLMLALVLSVNCLSDVVRDALDPHHVPVMEDAHG